MPREPPKALRNAVKRERADAEQAQREEKCARQKEEALQKMAQEREDTEKVAEAKKQVAEAKEAKRAAAKQRLAEKKQKRMMDSSSSGKQAVSTLQSSSSTPLSNEEGASDVSRPAEESALNGADHDLAQDSAVAQEGVEDSSLVDGHAFLQGMIDVDGANADLLGQKIAHPVAENLQKLSTKMERTVTPSPEKNVTPSASTTSSGTAQGRAPTSPIGECQISLDDNHSRYIDGLKPVLFRLKEQPEIKHAVKTIRPGAISSSANSNAETLSLGTPGTG